MSWFLKRLRKYKDDRAMMADLRSVLVESKEHRAWPALYRLGVPIDDEILPFVAGLFATHPVEANKGNFGDTCKWVEQKRDQKSADEKLTPTERRFQHLLAAERDEIQDRVRRMVLMAKLHDVPVNYDQLATDLKFWNDKTKTKWASAFWTPHAQSNSEEKTP